MKTDKLRRTNSRIHENGDCKYGQQMIIVDIVSSF